MEREPLGLQRGSVRAILAIVVVGGFVVVSIVSCFLEIKGDGMIALASLAGAVATYYFKVREEK
jgi:hypothetical protein